MKQPDRRDPHAYVVVLAGGRGTRFWPRSRRRLPKQLLPVVSDKPLLVETVERLAPLVAPERVWVMTSELLREQTLHLLPQIPDHQIIAEPAQRNTGPAIALPSGVALDAERNRALVVDFGLDGPSALLAIDLATGDRQIITGVGPEIIGPVGIAVDPGRDVILLTSYGVYGLLAIDIPTGQRVIASGYYFSRPESQSAAR